MGGAETTNSMQEVRASPEVEQAQCEMREVRRNRVKTGGASGRSSPVATGRNGSFFALSDRQQLADYCLLRRAAIGHFRSVVKGTSSPARLAAATDLCAEWGASISD